jgi:ectoine hydroxylase-related dioxygenase (phytanoyl-CoA dioxygenase family)
MPYSDEHRKSWEENGYFVVKDAVDPDMVGELRDAGRRLKERIRNGEFDLYTDWKGDGEPFHFAGLLSPQSEEPIFAEYMGSKPLLYYVFAQIGSDLQLGSCTIFTNPHSEPFICPWHRDDGLKYHQEEEPELEYLRQPRSGCRWELALVDDFSLHLVPGSHRRYRTEQELRVTQEGLDEELEGDLKVHFKAGETVFFTGDCLHRAVHEPDRERLSISASFRSHHFQEKEGIGRMAWMLEDGVREWLPEHLRFYYDRWVEQHSLKEAG